MRAFVPIFLAAGALLLAGCDQNKGANVTIKNKDGNVTISANGQHFTMQGTDGKSGSVIISGHGDHFTMKTSDGKSLVEINANGVKITGNLPRFVGIYPGAKVTSSIAGGDSNGAGGTLVMESSAAPADVIAFYRKKSDGAGFRQTLNMDQGGTLVYAAASGEKQLQVLAAKTDTGTHAQVTWSGK